MRLLWLTCALVWLASAPASAQRARVSMSSSATRVAVGEPFAIEIRADISGDDVDDIAVPDFGKLQVVGKRISRPFSFSFGFGSSGQHARVESQIVHSYTLIATEPGTHVIQPAIVSVGGRKFASQRLSIEATGAALPMPPGPGAAGDPNPSAGALAAPPDGELSGARYDNDLFVRTVVDKTSAFVGEQVTATVYVYVRGRLSQAPTFTREPTTEGFWVQDLLPLQRAPAPVQQTVNGRTFNVYVQRRYAAFPLRPGKLQFGAPGIEIGGSGGSLFDLITGPSAPVRRDGVSVTVDVSELPARAKSNPVSHVGTLALEASLDPAQGKVGDAFTLRVSAKGTGNLKNLKLPDPQLDGVEVLTPEIEDHVTTDLDIVGGERVFRWLLLPRKPGSLKVPAFAVDVFDPSTKAFQVARSQPLKLEISGKAQDGVPQTGAPGSAERVEALSFGPARSESALAREKPSITAAPWFPWAVLGGPLGVLAAFAGRIVAARVRARRAVRPGDQALRNAELKLRQAREAARRNEQGAVYAGILGALRAALSARLDEAVGGLTLQMLHAQCLSRGMPPPLADKIVGELERCEQARFDPSRAEGSSLESRVARAEELLRQLARFSPSEAPGSAHRREAL